MCRFGKLKTRGISRIESYVATSLYFHFSYSLIDFLNWTDKQTSLVTLQEDPLSGFRLKAGENSEKDPLFLIFVNIRNKTAGNAPLETLRITFVDNDG